MRLKLKMNNSPFLIFTEEDQNYSIGYLSYGWNIFMIFLSFFGIIINLYFGITYLRRIIDAKDTEFIKVITGVRRSVKSTLLLMFRDYLSGQQARLHAKRTCCAGLCSRALLAFQALDETRD